ncbi:mitochondrial fission protein ELM1-like [Phragmites australis]|uniref:mitochondrial fission protein ELM1-like n=1 Tax=Phragmites australis TaxID=29695 RepID=UPI002D7843EE|nr:mitochondrial fission protein ELM1-like [Phragmites australis]
MQPIRLPEPELPGGATPEIFAAGSSAAVVRRAVVIGNGCAGAESQCLGLLCALGLANRLTLYRATRPTGGINKWLNFLPISFHKLVDQFLRQVFSDTRFAAVVQGKKLAQYPVHNSQSFGLSSVLEADSQRIVTMVRGTFEKDGPALVVACGRDTISYASSIRRLAPDNVFVIQIQHPRFCLDRFDLVVTPCHDYYALTAKGQQEVPRLLRRWITPQEPPGSNVVFLTAGALHQADSAALRFAATDWHAELAPLPKPLVVVNIGGPTRNCKYDLDLAKQLVNSLHNVLKTCGSVRISFSRRTPRKVSNLILKEFSTHLKIYIWDGEEPNPHLGHLAWADAFIITADSISMLSEACSTGKPVYVIGTEQCRWKFSDFHNRLHERGAVRPFTGLEDMSHSWSYPPLNDAVDVAARVREVLAKRGWTVG